MAAVLLLLSAVLSANPPSADTVVVCPARFQTALQPWLELRRQQGHTIELLSNLGTPDNIRDRIRAVATAGKLRFVVLVGDANYTMSRDPALRMVSVPMHYAKSNVNVKYGSEPTISTDNWYAQGPAATDEKPLPEFAIGRITAATADELRQIVAKIVAYEKTADFGPWRQRVNLVAGAGGFGVLADSLIESTARQILTANIPAQYHVSMTCANWQSPYCPAPERFHQATLDRLNEGAMFWVYIGHAWPRGVAPLMVPSASQSTAKAKYPVLEMADAARLTCHSGQPIALFLCCYAGAIDAQGRCLASGLLAAPGGPVAVIAGSRVTMPYAMTVFSAELGRSFFQRHASTLGEAMLEAKQAMLIEPKSGDTQRAMLDNIAAWVDPARGQLAAERAEHVLMFNLIGDPLLRLRYPQAIALQSPGPLQAGASVTLQGASPLAGRGRLELVTRRDRLPGERPSRTALPKDAKATALFDLQYAESNDHVLWASDVEIPLGTISVPLKVPDGAKGACHLCLTVCGSNDMAAGACDVEVVKGR